MILTNRAPFFAWGLLAVWWLGLVIVTWVAWRDWPLPGVPPLWAGLFLLFFWSGGIAGTALALRKRPVTVEVTPAGAVRIAELGPLGRRRQTLQRGDVAALRIEESEDSDGDPYFRCWLELADGRRFAVAEGHRRQSVEHDAGRLRRALGL